MWFWYSTTAGLASAMEKVLNRVALKDRGNIAAYSLIYLSLIAFFSLWFSLPLKLVLSRSLILLLISQALFWTLGTLFSFLSYAKTEVSLSMIISRSRVLWMIPLGAAFLGERLNAYSIGGILLVFFGFLALFYRESLHKHQGIHFMIAGSIFVALGSVVNAKLVQNFLTPAQTTLTTMVGQSLLFLTIVLLKDNPGKRILEVTKRAWRIMILAAIIETWAFIGINLAFKYGYASTSTAVYLGMSVTSIWVGIIFLKERDYLFRKLISSALVTAGIIVLKLFG